MEQSELFESPNRRDGEPLRSWLRETPTVEHDARSVVVFAAARDALQRIIDGGPLTLQDQVDLGRLNSFCVAQWYEPVVTMLPHPHIDPEISAFFEPLLADV